MKREAKKYTQEFRVEAVKLALKSPSVTLAAKELGIPIATLHSWIKQLKNALPRGGDGKDIATLLEENRRLHKELLRTQEEREILKKAATYFAQHQK